MPTIQQNREFTKEIFGDDLLDQAIDFIQHSLEPDDVFSADYLKQWAMEEFGLVEE